MIAYAIAFTSYLIIDVNISVSEKKDTVIDIIDVQHLLYTTILFGMLFSCLVCLGLSLINDYYKAKRRKI